MKKHEHSLKAFGLAPATSITLLYLLYASAWIILSDYIVAINAQTTGQMLILSTLKGWGFVLVTGLLLFVLLRRKFRLIDEKQIRLEHQHNLLRGLFDSTYDAIIIQDPESGDILDMNRAAEKLYGIQRDALEEMDIGRLCSDTPPYTREEAVKLIQAAQKSPQIFEWKARRMDGSVLWVEVSLQMTEIQGLDRLVAVVRDITARMKSEKALRESESQFKILFENMYSGAVIYDPVDDGADFVIIDINKSGLASSKQQDKNLIGQRVTKAFPGIKETALLEIFQRVWRTGIAEELPATHYADGLLDVWVENYVFKLPSGRIVVNFNDITERKQFEDKIQAREAFLDSIIDQSPIPMWVAAPDGTIIRTNQALCSKLNVQSSQLIGKYNILEDKNLLKDDLLDKVKSVFEQSKTVQITTFWKAAAAGGLDLSNGRDLYIAATIIPVLDRSGALSHAVCQWEDITAHHEAETALRESEERFRSTINDLQVGVVVHRPDTSIILCNPAAARMLGVKVDEALGTINAEWTLVREDQSPMPVEELPVNQVIATEKTVYNQIVGIIRSDRAEPLWCNCTAVPVFDDENHIKNVIINFADISEIKKVETDLIEGKQTLRSALDGLSANIALLDEKGTILLVNQRWRDFAKQNGMPEGQGVEGTNYLSACENVSGEEAGQASEFKQGILDVLAEGKSSFSLEYPCHSEEEQRWFIVTVTLFPGDGPHRVVVSHENITLRKLAEEQLIARNNELKRFNDVAVGRELRMIELKKEVNALCRKLGKSEPYNEQAEEM